jgi:DUF4097 and DUF4098 domain-containing protein YvlB
MKSFKEHAMFTRTLCAALLIASSPVLAWDHDDDEHFDGSRSIDETRPLKADGTLFISNVAGSIEVQAWDKNEVHLTGELGDGGQKLEISGDVSSLRMEVQVPKRSHDVEDSTLRLQVPAGARVEIESVSADVTGQGLRGVLRAQTVSGDINFGVNSGAVDAQTVSGAVTLRAPSRDTKVNTVSGDIHIAGVREKLHVETVSGDIDVEADGVADMELKSVSGDMNVEAGVASAPKIAAETLSGEIRMYLPKEPDAVLTLHSFSGELQSGFGQPVGEGKKRYEATLGAGKGRIDLNSFSGDIRVSRGKH